MKQGGYMTNGQSESGLIRPSTLSRIKALFFDWLFICGYLILLLILNLITFAVVLDTFPEYTHMGSQLISTFTSVIPIIIIFSFMEGKAPFASWGKRRSGIKVHYGGSPITGAIIRNTIKFLPWQLGHMSTIDGIYHDYTTPSSMLFLTLSLGLFLVLIFMVLAREDGRHLGDLLARSRVAHYGKTLE